METSIHNEGGESFRLLQVGDSLPLEIFGWRRWDRFRDLLTPLPEFLDLYGLAVTHKSEKSNIFEPSVIASGETRLTLWTIGACHSCELFRMWESL
jgi:hypothetical protein